jgi:insulysin
MYLFKYLQSSEYLSVLIGHEGMGSLLSLLKNKNWATSLTAGPQVPYRGFATFQVSIGLTKDGYNNTDKILCHVFEVFIFKKFN